MLLHHYSYSCKWPSFWSPTSIISVLDTLIVYKIRKSYEYKRSTNYFASYTTLCSEDLLAEDTVHLFPFLLLLFTVVGELSDTLKLLKKKHFRLPSNPSKLFYRLCLGACYSIDILTSNYNRYHSL